MSLTRRVPRASRCSLPRSELWECGVIRSPCPVFRNPSTSVPPLAGNSFFRLDSRAAKTGAATSRIADEVIQKFVVELLKTMVAARSDIRGAYGYRAMKISTIVNRQKLATTTAVAIFSSLNSQSIGFSIVTL